ncbi:hypothetical protein Tco_0486721 [Tanacetum coccineum]
MTLIIQSVIGSLHVFWASVFVLPSQVLLDIEQIIRGFLWCQGKLRNGQAKVAWEEICLPKIEGGLGIRRRIVNVGENPKIAESMGTRVCPIVNAPAGRLLGAYDLGVATPRALVHADDKTSGDARSWYMISGDAKSWVCDCLHIFTVI